jgi:uncharacterized damage-inducible protein DinB
MLSKTFLHWFLKDLKKLKEEISLFKSDSDLWIIKGEIKNSAGTLALHICGNIKHFIGAQLGNTGYVRNRDKEFADRNIPKEILLKEIEEVIGVIEKTLLSLADEDLSKRFPIDFLGNSTLNGEMIFIVYGHMNYHLGQVNYLRRLL